MTIPAEAWGWLASACVLGAFLMRRMRPLRLIAIVSNLAFMVYAAELGLVPVLLLHIVLLPVNLWRLNERVAPELASQAARQCPERLTTAALCQRAARVTPRRTAGSPEVAALMFGALLVPNFLAAKEPLREINREVRVLNTGTLLGTLFLPSAGQPTGLVLLLPDRLGPDARSTPYIDQLLGAGLAVLDLLHGGEDGGAIVGAMPTLAVETQLGGLPIAAVGFGAGARTALRLGPGIAARVLLYPGCAGLAGEQHGASGPVLLLYGTADAVNLPEACAVLASGLAPSNVHQVIYPGASYAWDYPAYGLAHRFLLPHPDGQGRTVSLPWPELASMSATQVAGFLAAALKGTTR
ncbi:dienelactone hydrolase family protein [Teichococcus vastitatis]|uniref:Uncharacterized protein n=1 Tax=Teichococcus vastitatis TaxID=2307076 RepID=A0ABS9W6W7_9PROT|nr:hypothetical protein [Pseudoroseomonas vastitatis]MCI0754982.1 hypothetical protein [Pseudoroseomonas vastitatis]